MALLKKSAAERNLFPTIAATLHAGTFGQFLMKITKAPAPETRPPRPVLTNYGRMIMRGYFAGETHAEMRSKEQGQGFSAKQHQRKSVEAYRAYGARTSAQFIRRVVEVDGTDLLPPAHIAYENQIELARKLSARQVVHWGLLSYGLPHETIEEIFDHTPRLVNRTIGETKAALPLPHNTTEFVLAQFFADNVLRPESNHLPPDYVADSLLVLHQNTADIVTLPAEILPEGRYN